ncbi:PREDICTED: uncharacterized protein LOC104609465 [Nelumbo nucifera]|uniref:Uncharacterized protein LOC104609465 n=2 Tax=Nelumbo nucifera TaxID=4432 RepID=A0A1U8BC01_NELNU|nr:PREDICTED: uncharacterized protein LOC104609465 [Nelumbo nucifera]DAD43736.1 TPA_asm: hypothetical protein HUJ06_001966 [Nelumbo nucifera]
MNSISGFGSDYIFSTDFRGISPSLAGENVADAMWGDEISPFVGHGAINTTPPASDVVPSFYGIPYPERLGVPAVDVAESALPEFDMGLCGITGIQSLGSGYQPDVYEFGDNKRNAFASDFRQVHTGGDVWAIQGNSIPAVEERNLKVGRYTVEERKDRILKYLKKRNQRNFNKTIKYACRKTLADRRVRVRGRFARNNDVCEEATSMKNNNNDSSHQDEEEYYDDGSQMKLNEEDWLQEAVTNLMYLPIFSG